MLCMFIVFKLCFFFESEREREKLNAYISFLRFKSIYGKHVGWHSQCVAYFISKLRARPHEYYTKHVWMILNDILCMYTDIFYFLSNLLLHRVVCNAVGKNLCKKRTFLKWNVTISIGTSAQIYQKLTQILKVWTNNIEIKQAR